MFQEQRLRDQGTDATRSEQPGQRGDQVDNKNDQIAHRRIVAGWEILRNHGRNNNSPGTAAWTLQQLREAIPSDHSYRFLIHDRDAIFSAEVDQQLKAFGLRVLRTPVRAPKANAYCERLVGSVRRECLDFMIPVGEKHLRKILSEWVTHYNQGRPHLSLGPGIPESAAVFPPLQDHDKHSFPHDCKVAARMVLGGLHHEYRWERIAA